MWCWRWLLRVPWIARRSNQSILKEINPEYSLEGLLFRLKLQYFGHLMQRADSLEKTLCWERLKAVGEGDDRGWNGWMASVTRWKRIWASSRSWWWTGKPGMVQSTGLQRVRHDWVLNWSETSGGQSIRASASAPVLPINMQCWFPLGLTNLISIQSTGLSSVFSSTTIQRYQFFGTQPSLWSKSHIYTVLGRP